MGDAVYPEIARRVGGHWRRKYKSARDSTIELDYLDARFTQSDLRNVDLSAQELSLTGDLNSAPDYDAASDDSFKVEVARKTQLLCIGRQEAETEVFIDKMVERLGRHDRALIYVTAEMAPETRVQILVNTLLHRGANPSASNRDLRTPLHFAVTRNFRGVAAKLLENDALPHARDKYGVLPLNVAMDNANDDMASLLLTYMSNWFVRSLFISDGHKLAEFSFHSLLKSDLQKAKLSVLDCMVEQYNSSEHIRVYYGILECDNSGRPPQDPLFQRLDWSPFQLIANHGQKSIVYHDVVRLLIRRKWKSYARRRFISNSVIYIITLFAFTYAAITGTLADDVTRYDSALHYTRAVFEFFAFSMACFTLLTELNQLRKHKLQYFKDAFNYVEFPSAVLIICVLPLRYSHRNEQWYAFAFGYLLWVIRIFKYASIFRQTGAYAQILWRIIGHDFPQFMVVFAVILVGFSGAFLLALKGDDNIHTYPDTSSFWGILFMGVRTLTDGEPVVDYAGPNGYATVSTVLMVCFLFVTCVILLNILIAQLSDTYQNVQADAQRGLEVSRAWNVARVELNSWCYGQRNRLANYVEYEDIADIKEALEKWESPPINEMNKYVHDIWDNMDTHKMNLLTIKNRLARQESTLVKIQNALEKISDSQSAGLSVPSSIIRQIIPDTDQADVIDPTSVSVHVAGDPGLANTENTIYVQSGVQYQNQMVDKHDKTTAETTTSDQNTEYEAKSDTNTYTTEKSDADIHQEHDNQHIGSEKPPDNIQNGHGQSVTQVTITTDTNSGVNERPRWVVVKSRAADESDGTTTPAAVQDSKPP